VLLPNNCKGLLVYLQVTWQLGNLAEQGKLSSDSGIDAAGYFCLALLSIPFNTSKKMHAYGLSTKTLFSGDRRFICKVIGITVLGMLCLCLFQQQSNGVS
jgi:hypothetical protein